MNRRISAFLLAIAASALVVAVLLLRPWSTVDDHPVIVVKALPPTSQPARRRLPRALSLDPGSLPTAGSEPAELRRARPGFDAATVETVRGRIATSKPLEAKLSRGMPPERLVLESDGQQIVVKLGPPRGLQRAGFDRLNLAPGDEVEVTGSRLKGRRHILIAATIAKGGETVVLRDDRGEPGWIPPRRNPQRRQRRGDMPE